MYTLEGSTEESACLQIDRSMNLDLKVPFNNENVVSVDSDPMDMMSCTKDASTL